MARLSRMAQQAEALLPSRNETSQLKRATKSLVAQSSCPQVVRPTETGQCVPTTDQEAEGSNPSWRAITNDCSTIDKVGI